MTLNSLTSLLAVVWWTLLLPCHSTTVISSVEELFEDSDRYESLTYRFPGEEDEGNATYKDDMDKGKTESMAVGEDVADIKKFPYLVAVQARFPLFPTGFSSWFFVCGGSLVAKNKILTAAHWVEAAGAEFRVLLGTNNFKLSPEADVIAVAKVYSHPKYRGDGFFDRRGFYANDVAVLALEKEAVLSDKVQIIELAEDDDSFVGEKCVIAGYGALDSSTFRNSPIHSAEVTVLSVKGCQNIINTLFQGVIYIRRLHVCTLDEGVSPCFGDSGSALVCDGKAIGVFSFVDNRCSGSVLPVGYLRVSWYRDFLDCLIDNDQ